MASIDLERLMNKWLQASEFYVVGKRVERTDSLEKAMGITKFTEDFYMKDMLFVKQILSKHPHARIVSIDDSEARRVNGFLRIVRASDIPGENQVGYSLPDQPLLAHKKVRYVGEPVALVIARDFESAIEASRLVSVSYEPIPYIINAEEAIREKNILVHEENGSNIAFRTKVRKGDVEKGFSESHVVVENTYRTAHQEHAYLETEAAIAIPGLEGKLTIISPSQYPHLTQKIVSKVLGLPASSIRVIVPYLGGGFGGKDDQGPLTSAKAALVSYLTGKPSFIIYSREESIAVHPKREATTIRYKSGADAEGKLKAIEVEIIHDTGAYANRGPFILWRATMHASGPYEVPNAKVDGYCVYTNKIYQGSFRGFGNPSVQFAAESQMDILAEKLGIDPLDIRLKNILTPGARTITGQELDSSVGIKDALEAVAKRAEWREKRIAYSRERGTLRRGIGIGVAWHGISTSRGVPDWSAGTVKIEPDGSVSVLVGIVEIGQGSPSSSHRQIVAEVLGAPLNMVHVYFGTSDAPDGGATHASRGTGIGAIGIYVASIELRERLNALAAKLLETEPEDISISDGIVSSKSDPSKRISWTELIKKAYSSGINMTASGYFFLPKGKFYDDIGQGFAYISYSYMALITEVQVDTETGEVKVLKVYPAISAGKVINPVQVEGQIEGGFVQGMGMALMESLSFNERGEIVNKDLTDYVIPSSLDAPEIEEPIFIEDRFKYGPLGAKGVGEMALIPAPASIANAVSHAIGKRVVELPITAEKVLKLIEGR
ncbi:MAG: xanthine dehydrogenase family protein molybdopterin-binding subunit [Fervidicoccaceae archaeon]